MNNIDRVVVLVVIASVVVCLVMQHRQDHDIGAKVATGNVNMSERPSYKRGPAYLLSNLPIARNYDDTLPVVGDFPSC